MNTQTSTQNTNASNVHSIEGCKCREHNDFTEVKVMLDLSFKERSLVKCNQCRKYFVREYEMHFDWHAGYEWIDTYFIPVKHDYGIIEAIKTGHIKVDYDKAV